MKSRAVDGLSNPSLGSYMLGRKHGELTMAYATGEVVANLDTGDPADRPFMVVFKHGDEVIGTWPVASEEEGEAQIKRALLSLKDIARKEGFIK